MSYTPTYKRPYEQWKELPSKETLVTAEVLTQYDDTFENIEEYLESEGKKEYALVTEAGYSLALSIDSNYVMTISLKNKAGEVLDSKHIDFPIESMIVNVGYDEESGILTFSLQNGQTLSVNISTLIRGLVPTSRKIAGVDLEDDITREELEKALNITHDSITTTELVLNNSFAGTLQINEIGGNYVQDGTPSIDNPINPTFSVINTITTRDDNGNSSSITLSNPITLRSNGDSSDIITKENGVWGVNRYFQEKTASYSNSTAMNILTNSKELRTTSVTTDDMLKSRKYLCDKASYVSNTWDVDEVDICSFGGSGTFFQLSLRVPIGSTEDVETNIVYLATTSTFEELPSVDQEALQSLKTYDGTTYIEFDSEVTPNVNVTYPSSDVNGRLDVVEKDIVALQDDVDDVKSSIASVSDEVDAVESNIDAINSRLAYKDISSSIDIGESGCTASGYVESGQVRIDISVPKGSSSNILSKIYVDSIYAPRNTTGGHLTVIGTGNDFGKVFGTMSVSGAVSIFVKETLNENEVVSFTYPLKSR